jgi:hypothetical protein
MWNRDGGSGGDYKNAPTGWYRISTYAGPGHGEQMECFRKGKNEEGTRFAYFRFPVLEPTDEMLAYLPEGEVRGPADATTIPIGLTHPLDALTRDEQGNIIPKDRNATTIQWLSKFGATLSDLDLSRSDEAVWDDIVWLLRNGARQEAVVNVYSKGWPNFRQGPAKKELLAVFRGFQYFDYRARDSKTGKIVGRPAWALEQSNWVNEDGSIRYNRETPALFEIVAPTLMAGTIITMRFLNYTVTKSLDKDDVVTFWDGGSKARFPSFCSTIGVDLESLVAAHEDEAVAILEDDDRAVGSYIPEILDWVEREALAVAAEGYQDAAKGHFLHIKTEERGFIVMEQMNVASPPVMERIGGKDFELRRLVSIAEKPAMAEREPVMGDGEGAEPAGAEPVVVTAAADQKLMPVSGVVETYNGLAKQMGFEEDVCTYDAATGMGKFVSGLGHQFALRALLPLFNYGPLGLDRKKGFSLTEEAHAFILQVCFSEEYLKLAGEATNENPFPGDLEARLGIALAEVRTAAYVEEDEIPF